MSIDYGLYIVIYFVLCIAGSLIAYSSKNPLVSFLGYNLIVIPVGGLLSICIPTLSEGVVTAAMLETAIIVGLMIIFSCIYPGFFESLGRTLFICLLVGITVEILVFFLFNRQWEIIDWIFDWAFVILFALYIGYDWCVAQEYGRSLDNAVDSAIDIYLDIINIFVRLCSLLSKKDD